jgi:hypothetical protein
MLQKLILSSAFLLILLSCKKNSTTDIDPKLNMPQSGQFYEYIIREGQHYANFNAFQSVQYRELKFVVKFDNSAEYSTIDASNQEDINKLYGFSDNNADHHQFSARFGWNWARGSLRLYAYVYNNGERSSKEIIAIQPGQEYGCSIKVAGDKYIFSVGTAGVETYRASTTELATGYKLYPYFGGNETAPHDVRILIKE